MRLSPRHSPVTGRCIKEAIQGTHARTWVSWMTSVSANKTTAGNHLKPSWSEWRPCGMVFPPTWWSRVFKTGISNAMDRSKDNEQWCHVQVFRHQRHLLLGCWYPWSYWWGVGGVVWCLWCWGFGLRWILNIDNVGMLHNMFIDNSKDSECLQCPCVNKRHYLLTEITFVTMYIDCHVNKLK